MSIYNASELVRTQVLEGHEGAVNAAYYDLEHEAVISVSDDRSMRIWLRHSQGDFWPSVNQTYECEASCMFYDEKHRRLFVGLHNGRIMAYTISEDFNRVLLDKEIPAHTGRVLGIYFDYDTEWLMSVGRDKAFMWHSADSGRKMGTYSGDSWCSAVAFDSSTSHAFVGDYAGNIHIFHLSKDGLRLLSSLKGNVGSKVTETISKVPYVDTGSVKKLWWDTKAQRLYSACFDNSVVVWDIGGQKGQAYQLFRHEKKIRDLIYLPSENVLLTAGEDQKLVLWDMTVNRSEAPEWGEADFCQKCNEPFFWNVKAKINTNRQHHCRKCGKALCHNCCQKTSTLPKLGFELPVRVCFPCVMNLSSDELQSLIRELPLKQQVYSMQYIPKVKQLLTAGKDGVINLWTFRI